MYDCSKFFIDGEWVAPIGGGSKDVINPADKSVAGRISLGNTEDVDRAVAAARRAFETYSQTSREERLELLSLIIDIYERRIGDVAKAISVEMGAPMKLSEQAQAPAGLRHFNMTKAALEIFEFTETASDASIVVKEPIGVCGFITPWNWPMNQVVAKVAPALAAGCTIVHKPSVVAPLCSHILAEILEEAGVPAGVYNLVDGEGTVVGSALASHPDVDMVSITGSTPAGIDVAEKAAATVKRVTQELGGKSANVILADADFENAITMGATGCFRNTGQSCNSPSRMLVPQGRMDDAAEITKTVAENMMIGDPADGGTDIGPIAYERQYEKVLQLIGGAIEEGATLVCGGVEKPEGTGNGYFVKPTVFANVTSDMTIAKEEVFGPVLSIMGYGSEDEALTIANDSEFGLSGYVYGESGHATKFASKMRTGMVHINGSPVDGAAPFGGYKKSGNGREFGKWGLEEFFELKAIMGYAKEAV